MQIIPIDSSAAIDDRCKCMPEPVKRSVGQPVCMPSLPRQSMGECTNGLMTDNGSRPR